MRARHKAAIVVVVITALVFLPSVTGAFVFDDIQLISTNEYVQSWQHVGRAFRTHFWDVPLHDDAADVRRYYRPLVTLSYLVNWILGGGKPWAFHVVNVVLHALTAGLAYRAATRWTRSIRLGFACALVFALHPSRTENVTWISGRTDVMMLLTVFLALEAFRAYRQKARWTMFGCGVVAFAAAILTKEPGAMVAVLALADRELTTDTVRASRKSWLVPALTGALGVCYIVARQFFWAPEGNIARHFTPQHFLVTVGLYVLRSLLPWPPTMYYHALEARPDGTFIYSVPLTALGLVALIASAYAAFIAWRRARPAFWLLVAAYAFIGPLLNLYFTGSNFTAHDRFLYAPLFFAVTAIAVLLRAQLARVARRHVTAFVLGGALLAATFVVEIRTLDYRSNEAFWQAELAHSPDHPYALQNLGTAAAARGDLAEAYDYFTRAEQPSAVRFRLAGGDKRRLEAHFLRAIMLAGLLPDGRGEELATLLDELWRVEEAGFVPPRGTVRDYEIGTPIRMSESNRAALEKSFQWDIALIATRVGDFHRTQKIVDHASRDALVTSASPLNGALALARLGRLDDARSVGRTLAERSKQGLAAPPDEEIAGFAEQLHRAGSVHNDVLRLASLGAFLAALRRLEADGALDSPDAAPLVAQLLVACRLESGAREHVGKHLGPDRAPAVVGDLVQQLPAPLRAIPPIEARTKEELLAGVKRRTR